MSKVRGPRGSEGHGDLEDVVGVAKFDLLA